MHVAARVRLALARRPWIHWVVVAGLATGLGVGVDRRLAEVDRERATWGDTRTVLVADTDLAPDAPITVTPTELPVAAVPERALTELPSGARLRQHVAAGEVLVDLDVTARPGPAARASAGSIVVAVTDPSARHVTIGVTVAIAADGSMLAARATVVDLADDVVFVAVDAGDAATVAAAAHDGSASLLYVP